MRALNPRSASFVFLVLGLASTAVAQASWQLTYPPSPIPYMGGWHMTFDEAHGAALLLLPNPTQPGDYFWRWNGTAWDQPSAAPPPHADFYVAYDAARQRVVLYGWSTSYVQDLWEWNGVVWQQRAVPSFPPVRYYAAFAFDRARNACVLFGGNTPTGTMLSDTWEWNGTVWTQANPPSHPSARRLSTMAFDPSTQRMLLYGGWMPGGGAQGTLLTDTWTWDGVVWQQQQPATPPFQRQEQTMVSDLARSRIVLYGGNSYDFQTWEWDGAQWHASVPGSPGPLFAHSSTYDTWRREVLLFGGAHPTYGPGPTSDLWRYRTASPADALQFGAGCAGAAGAPVLANAPYTLPWLGDTMRTRVSNIAQNSLGALFVTSFTPSFLPMSLAPVGAPGCDLYLQPEFVDIRTPVGSVVDFTLAIPSTPSLVGVVVFQQALPHDPAANPLGLTITNGLRMVLGIR